MNRLFGTLIFSAVSVLSFGQLSSTFNTNISQSAGDRDTLDIILTNDYDVDILVNVGGDYQSFGDVVFEPLASSVNINAGGSEVLRVAVFSRHNLEHNYLLSLEVPGFGTYGVQLSNEVSYSNHYNGTYNLTGDALKAALKSAATSGHNSLGYNTARDRMYMDIDNLAVTVGSSVNELIGVYTGDIIGGFSNRSQAQNMGFNTEHTFPQGFFSSNEPMRSDLFHLFPTNANANSQRGNLPFGVVSGSSTWSVGGSKKGGGRFEPRDAHKGQVARAMMYFVIRYQDYSNHFAGQETILRTWHDNFPVGSLEEDRNDRIDQYQGNRNPFIDYPQFVERFTSFTSNGDLSTSLASSLSDTVLSGDQNETYSFVFANTGSETIQIGSINLTNTTDFSISVSGDNELLPGEGVEVEVVFNTANSNTNGFVEIDTDENGGSNYSVRLAGEGVDPNSVIELNSADVHVFPNPFNEVVSANQELHNFKLIDVTGKVIFQQEYQSKSWNIQNVPSGVYVIQATTTKGKDIRSQIVKD